MILIGSSTSPAATGSLLFTFVSLQVPSLLFLRLVFDPKRISFSSVVYLVFVVAFVLFVILSLIMGPNYFYGSGALFSLCFLVDLFVILYQAAWYMVENSAQRNLELQASPQESPTEDVEQQARTEQVIEERG